MVGRHAPVIVHSQAMSHPAEVVWRLLQDFCELAWMPGPESVTRTEYEGCVARTLNFGEASGLEPIIEYLISVNPETMTLIYGVKKNPFVPVDGYRATVNVKGVGSQSEILFSGTYSETEAVPGEVAEMLMGAYQMMAGGIDTYLSATASR